MTSLLLSNKKGYTGVFNANLVLSELRVTRRRLPSLTFSTFCPVSQGSQPRVKPSPALQAVFTIARSGY